MKYTLTFGALGLVCAFYAFTVQAWVMHVFLAAFAVAWCGVSLAYAGLGARTFLKRADGRLHPFSYLFFWPYYAFNVLSLGFYRLQRGGHLWDEIAPNVYLGGVLTRQQAKQARGMGIINVLDVTSEWGATCGWGNTNYKTIPVLDTRAPISQGLMEGAHWMQDATQRGPVYVHCALGHGRSATFVAAYLMLSNQAANLEEAIAILRAKRPAVTLSSPQLVVLHAFDAALHSAA